MPPSSRNGFSAYIHDQENETNETLANIATSQAANCQAFCQLITTNSELAEQLRTALTDISSLKNLVLNKQPHKPRKPHNSYCWTHGFRIADGHTSQSCKNQRAGHQISTTKDNIMGGSTAGQVH
jgi:hypothetical protein